MCYCPTCPPIIPCGTKRCRTSCRPAPPCSRPCCPAPVPCTPCPPCRCKPVFRACPPPAIPDYVPPIVPILPRCKPRRPPPFEVIPRPPKPMCWAPVLPLPPPPEPCDLPPVRPCPDPTPCYQPVLPFINNLCPTPILPKQRPYCPRVPPTPYPCLPLDRSCCQFCNLMDPVTRRRPLIVGDSCVWRGGHKASFYKPNPYERCSYCIPNICRPDDPYQVCCSSRC